MFSWSVNELIGIDIIGNPIVFERWGASKPGLMLTSYPVERFALWNAYRNEARAMVLDLISRRSKRSARFRNVLDCAGVTLAHRKLLPYIKEWG